jgi:hypothetical protein
MTEGGTMEADAKTSAAYLPFKTFLTGLDYLKTVSIPNQVEPGAFHGMSGQARSQVISAFKFFKLIDAKGTPQPDLHELVNNDTEERKVIVKRLIENRYPDIVALDFAKMTPNQLDEKLSGEQYNIGGETKKKAKTFLLKAAIYAGFKVHPLLTKITRNRRREGGKRATAKMEHVEQNPPEEKHHSTVRRSGTHKTIELGNGGSLTLSLDMNLLELKGKQRAFVFDLIDRIEDYESQGKVIGEPESTS